MKTYFSKRYAVPIDKKQISTTLPKRLRKSILKVLENHRRGYGDDIFLDAQKELETFYGQDFLQGYDENNNKTPVNFSGCILSGWPPHVFDCIEAWFVKIDSSTGFDCERELNDIFRLHNCPWRFSGGEAILVDSAFIRHEIILPLLGEMDKKGITGASDEFKKAVEYLKKREPKEAITQAHKSLESVLKAILGMPEARFGQLISELVKSGVIPDYYDRFLSNLEQLLLAAGKERNLPGRGHGQGKEIIDIPLALAEFAVHLVAVMNLFLIRRWSESQDASDDDAAVEPSDDDDLPF